MRTLARVAGGVAAVCIAFAVWIGAGCSDCSLSVQTAELPDAVVGERYFFELDSHCGGDFWFIQTGLLPPGIGLQDNGDIAGTPTIDGTFPFTIGVFDFGSGETAYRGLAITVAPAP